MVVQRIDLENPDIQDELEELKKQLSEKFMKKKSCGIDDFVMVTATNYIEEDHIDKPVSQIPFAISPQNEFFIQCVKFKKKKIILELVMLIYQTKSMINL